MIVAITKMRRIPKACKDCKLSEIELYGRRCKIENRMCPIEQTKSGNYKYGKPDWCPLEEVQKHDRP